MEYEGYMKLGDSNPSKENAKPLNFNVEENNIVLFFVRSIVRALMILAPLFKNSVLLTLNITYPVASLSDLGGSGNIWQGA